MDGHTLVPKVSGSFGLGSEISRGSETRARGRVAGGYPEGMGEGGRRGAAGVGGQRRGRRAAGVGGRAGRSGVSLETPGT